MLVEVMIAAAIYFLIVFLIMAVLWIFLKFVLWVESKCPLWVTLTVAAVLIYIFSVGLVYVDMLNK